MAQTMQATTMKAAVLHAIGQPLQFENLPIPEPGPGELLVKVTACGVCHSDLHAVDGDWTPGPALPLIPGHEVTGHVAAIGAGVTDFALGEAVGVPWMWSACGTCEWCLAGMETICPKGKSTGYGVPGGYAEYMLAPAAFVARLPAGADLHAVAPILCAGVTTYRGLKRSGARPGQWVAVLGVGGLGHVAVQYAVAMGFQVVAIDVTDDKLALARSLGAKITVNGASENPVATLGEQIGGVHAAVVTAVATRAFEQAVQILRPGGTAVYIGIPGGTGDEVRTSIYAIAGKELSIRGSNVGTRQDLNEAVAFALRGQVAAHIERQPLSAANAVLDRMRQGKLVGRVVLDIPA